MTEQEVRMLRILLHVCSMDQAANNMVLDDYDSSPEERFVMTEILEKLGGKIPPFDLATGMDMGYYYADIRKRMTNNQ